MPEVSSWDVISDPGPGEVIPAVDFPFIGRPMDEVLEIWNASVPGCGVAVSRSAAVGERSSGGRSGMRS